MLGRELGQRLAVLLDREATFAGQPPVPIEDGDLVLAQQIGDAIGELLGDRARSRDDLAGIEADVFCGEPEFIETMEQMINLRAAQQRLGRDAAPIEADAAELLALDERRLHAELRSPDRSNVAARPAAEDDQVEGRLGHRTVPT